MQIINEYLKDFTFIRPYFLGLLIFVPFTFKLFRLLKSSLSAWVKFCDAHLIANFIVKIDTKTESRAIKIIMLSLILVIFALSGPSIKEVELPAFKNARPIAVMMDLSLSGAAQDITPNRFTMAKLKLNEILTVLKDRQLSFNVYSSEPFPVTPITYDLDIIKNYIPMLDFSIVPPITFGRIDRAIKYGCETIKEAGISQGDVLILTGSALKYKEQAIKEARKAKSQACKIYILGIGGKEPVSIQEINEKGEKGNTIELKLDESELKSIAKAGGGEYIQSKWDGSDIDKITKIGGYAFSFKQKSDFSSKIREDAGYFLILPLLILLPFLFRKGVLFTVLFTLSFTLTKQSYAFDIMAIFKSVDRRAYEAILDNDPQKAVQLFKNKDWQAAANFRADNFDKAIEMYAAQNTDEGFYNLGNALAQKQELEQAIEAYKKALELNPNHEDAKYNKELIEEFLENQDKDKDKQGDNQDQNKNQENQNQGDDKNKDSSGGQDKQDENNQQQQSSQQQGGGEQQQNQSQDNQNNQNEQQSQNKEDKSQGGQGDNPPQNQDTKNSEDSQKNKQAMDAIPDDPAYYLRAKIRQLYFKGRYKDEDN